MKKFLKALGQPGAKYGIEGMQWKQIQSEIIITNLDCGQLGTPLIFAFCGRNQNQKDYLPMLSYTQTKLASQTLSGSFSTTPFHSKQSQLCYQSELQGLLKLIFKGLLVSQQGRKQKSISDDDSDATKGISLQIFTKFSKLPQLVGLALFRAFDDQKQGVLTQEAFVYGFSNLVFAKAKQKLRLVFKMLQLSNNSQDNQIRQKDCQILLYHMGIQCGCYISGIHQNKTRPEQDFTQQADIDNSINSLFSGSSSNQRKGGRAIGFQKFCQFCIYRQSDLPALVLSFLYDRIRLVPMLNNYLTPEAMQSESHELESYQSKLLVVETPQFYQFDKLARIRYLRNIPPIKKLLLPAHSRSSATKIKPYLFEKSKSLDAPPPSEHSLFSELGVKHKKIGSAESDPLSKWKKNL